ncbi:hypothetical protein HDU97_004200 [Phlyctochytrium planicorne]|nr:hypothetical protein HDU97_004200 [Phlyctochytrium planicorne]
MLSHRNSFELAIKKAHVNPIVRWLHEKAVRGDTVQVRVGGGFYLPDDSKHSVLPSPPPESAGSGGAENLILIAGGVGVTPLISMATHVTERNAQLLAQGANPESLIRATMLYSVRDESEILFGDRLRELSDLPHSGLIVRFFISQRGPSRFEETTLETPETSPLDVYQLSRNNHSVHHCFINEYVLGAYLSLATATGNPPSIYMCGPASMEQDVVRHLKSLKFPETNLHYEKCDKYAAAVENEEKRASSEESKKAESLAEEQLQPDHPSQGLRSWYKKYRSSDAYEHSVSSSKLPTQNTSGDGSNMNELNFQNHSIKSNFLSPTSISGSDSDNFAQSKSELTFGGISRKGTMKSSSHVGGSSGGAERPVMVQVNMAQMGGVLAHGRWNALTEADIDFVEAEKRKLGTIEVSSDRVARYILNIEHLSKEEVKRQEVIFELILTERE